MDAAVSLLELLGLVIGRWRSILLLGLLGGAAGAGAALLSREYVAESVFVPQRATELGNLAGLAAQFGLPVAAVGEAESPDFYAGLVRSRDLLLAALEREYRFVLPGGDSLAGTYADLYQLDGESHEERRRETLRRAERDVYAARDLRTGMVTFRTKAHWPAFAEQLNRALLDAVGEFNLRKRRTQAAAERAFVEQRLAVVQGELDSAEAELAGFLQRNRQYLDSPRLVHEKERLQRRVDLRQQVYVSLAQAYEQARIDEVRDTPVITIVDGPEGAAEPVRKLPRNVILGALLGSLAGLMATLGRVYLDRQRSLRPDDYEALVRGLEQARPRWRRREAL